MQTSKNYPTKKILISYALLGGLVGGLLFCAGMGTYLLIEQATLHIFDTSLNGIKNALVGFTMIMLVAWLVGLVPAFLTGLILTETRTHWQLTKPFVVGTIVTFILVFLVSSFGFGTNLTADKVLENVKFSGLLALVGGISSLIVGKFTLPKT